jgi:hypothetical protein
VRRAGAARTAWTAVLPALMDLRLSVAAAVIMLAVLRQRSGARAGEQQKRQGAGDRGLHIVQSCGAEPLQ